MIWAMKRASKGFINRTYHRLRGHTRPLPTTHLSVKHRPFPVCSIKDSEQAQLEEAKWLTPEVLVQEKENVIPPPSVPPPLKKTKK
jgi:hypothetical protein